MGANNTISASRKLLRLAALRGKLDVCTDTIYRWIRESGFPKPIKLSRNTGMWDEAEVDAWIEARAAQRAA